MSTRRGIIAAALAVLYPGLGHVYLRDWWRAIGWFSLAVLTALLVIPEPVIEAAGSGGIQAVIEASRGLRPTAVAALVFVRVLNVIDAYIRGAGLAERMPGAGRTDAGEPRCPNCGKELDPDLDFCPWCTAELARTPAAAEGGEE